MFPQDLELFAFGSQSTYIRGYKTKRAVICDKLDVNYIVPYFHTHTCIQYVCSTVMRVIVGGYMQ